MIDFNKDNSTIMWKTLEELIRSKSNGNREEEGIEFESLDNNII